MAMGISSLSTLTKFGCEPGPDPRQTFPGILSRPPLKDASFVPSFRSVSAPGSPQTPRNGAILVDHGRYRRGTIVSGVGLSMFDLGAAGSRSRPTGSKPGRRLRLASSAAAATDCVCRAEDKLLGCEADQWVGHVFLKGRGTSLPEVHVYGCA